MNKIFLMFFVLMISISAFSQMVMVPNQPSPKYYQFFKPSDPFYFLEYKDLSNNPEEGMYQFDGNNFENIPLPVDPVSGYDRYRYLGNLNDSFIFGEDVGAAYFENIYEYDGQQVIEVPLPLAYDAFVYLASFNGKIFFGAQIFGEAPVMLSYDGNTVETIFVPGVLLGGGNFHYSSDNNLLFLELHQTQLISDLWAFDGQDFTLIESPQDRVLVKIHHEFDGMLLLEYYDTTTIDTMVLYNYDGTSLTEIENPPNTSFFDIQLTTQENKIYVTYENTTNYDFILYKYDYEVLTTVSNDYHYNGYRYFTTFDGKDFISMGLNDGSNLVDLIAYDGTSLNIITGGPENLRPRNFAGIRNDKMYIVYADGTQFPNETLMVEYAQGASSVTLVPDMPQDKTFFRLVSQLDNKLFYEFRLPGGSYYFSLYVFDDLGFREIEIPNYNYSVYEFTLNEKIYASGYQGTDSYKLFSLDVQNLNVEEVVPENAVTIFPNPTEDVLNIKFKNIEGYNNIEIGLYSMDGRLIDHTYHKQNELKQTILYPVNHLKRGVYLIDFKTNSGSFQKKIIKL